MSDEHHDHPEPHGHELVFAEKIEKMLNQWFKHNDNHASNYRNWAEKAKANGMNEAGTLLDAAAVLSLAINDKFKAAMIFSACEDSLQRIGGGCDVSHFFVTARRG